MTYDDIRPTPELLAAVQAERERLESLIEDLKHRRTDLVEELQAVDDRLRSATSRHRQLRHALGEDDPQPALWEPDVREVLEERPALKEDDGLLRGAAIRRAAVRAALGEDRPESPRHYREWLDLIEAAGRRIDGRDPGATLLTQLSRCPLIARAPHAGPYQLDPGALHRLEAKREALHAEAANTLKSAAGQEDRAIDLARVLAQVEAEVRRTDRTIAEAKDLIETLNAWAFFSGSFARSTAIAPAA